MSSSDGSRILTKCLSQIIRIPLRYTSRRYFAADAKTMWQIQDTELNGPGLVDGGTNAR